ncbi:MAG TPA: hypothetical protein DCZ80_01810 [Legionellales bacterium]|nr:hypothetical protein [Legionellales bacterium]
MFCFRQIILSFFCLQLVFAHSATVDVIDERIIALKRSIAKSENEIKEIQKEKKRFGYKHQRIIQEDKQSHPLVNTNSYWLAKDYTRYPPNPYPNYFKYTTDDLANEIEFHLWFQGDMDSLMNINGLIVNDGRIFVPVGSSNSIQRYWIRRLRPSVQGYVDDYINYFLNVDMGMSNFGIFDAFIDINYFRLLGFQFGQQMSLVSGIENFFDNFSYLSRAYTMEMSHTQMLAPDREFGFVFHGSFGPSGQEPYYTGLSLLGFDDFFSYQLGILTGAPDDLSPENSFNSRTLNFFQNVNFLAYDVEGRIFTNPFIEYSKHPLQHLGLGLALSSGRAQMQDELPSLVSIAQNPIYFYEYNTLYNNEYAAIQVVANGARTRIHPQAVWSYGPLGLIGDLTQSKQKLGLKYGDTLLRETVEQTNRANQLSVIYNLTQEEFNLFHFIPNQNFHIFEKGAWGGLQAVFRISGLSLDPSVFNNSYQKIVDGKEYTYYYFVDPRISVQKATSWSIGLNWYWNQYLRFTFEYDQTKYVGGCSTGAMNATTGTPGCLMGSNDTYLSSSQVINRPDEKVYMQRVQISF